MAKFIRVHCKRCNKTFHRPIGRFNEAVKYGWNQFCSRKCELKYKTKKQTLKCANCGKIIFRANYAISHHNYCSRSCAVIVNNEKYPKINAKKIKCANCDIFFKTHIIGNKKYCSMKCFSNARLYNKEKLLKIIKETAKKLKRAPARRELHGGVDHACMRLFGSWNNAISAAGFMPNRSHNDKMYKRVIAKATDGHLCDSISELLIDNWLYKNNILHEREASYPNTRHRADWKIFSDKQEIFVEYFGLANDSPRYDRCIKEKINICNKNKITLIAIYPKDLYPKNFLENNLKIKFKDYLPI